MADVDARSPMLLLLGARVQRHLFEPDSRSTTVCAPGGLVSAALCSLLSGEGLKGGPKVMNGE